MCSPRKAAGILLMGRRNASETGCGPASLPWAQLHGQEDEAYIARLKSLTDRPLFQAFSISGPEDVDRAERSGADCILLDQGAGGTGKAFDWSLAKSIRRPWFLAGGLDCQNIGEALRTSEPWGVDVSSGVETEGTVSYTHLTLPTN